MSVRSSQRTWAGALRTPDNPSDTRAIYRVWEGQLAGGLHNRMAIALKDPQNPENPKNGHLTLLNTCINWDPTAFWVPPNLAHLIMGHENSPKICSKKCGFLGVLGGPKKGQKWAFLGFFEVF